MIDKSVDGWGDDRGAAVGVIPVGDGEGWRHVPPGMIGQSLMVLDKSGRLGYSTPSGGAGSGSANVVYASSISGIHLDGLTDDTALIQAVLDAHGTGGTPLRLVMDGISAINTLYVYTGQHIDGIMGLGGFRKLPYPSSNGLMAITNKHWVLGTTTVGGTDQYITLTNLYIDGNRRNGGAGLAYPNGGYPGVNASFCMIPTIGFYGLTFLNVSNVHVFDSTSFGLHLANVVHGRIYDFSMIGNLGDNYGNYCVVQHQGYCDDVRCFGLVGSTNDDSFAYNANDWNDLAGAGSSNTNGTYTTGTVVQGPIQHCEIDGGMFWANSSGGCSGGLLLSSNPSSYIANITIKNTTHLGVIRPFQLNNASYPLGSGSYDNIILENIRIENAATAVPAILVGPATIGNLILKDIHVLPTAANTGTGALLINSGSTSVSSLRVSGLDWENAAGWTTASIVALQGTVAQATFRDCRFNQGTIQGPSAIYCSGTIGSVEINGGFFDHLNDVLQVGGGTTGLVQATNVVHTNFGIYGSFAQTAGTFSKLVYSACSLASPATYGTIGNVQPGTVTANIVAGVETPLAAALASNYTLTTSMANIGLSITLPAAGTYLLMATARSSISFSNTTAGLGFGLFASGQLYDSTNSTPVPNSQSMLLLIDPPNVSQTLNSQQTSVIGPAFYTVAGLTVIQLQAFYGLQSGGTVTSATIATDVNGGTNLSAVRVA